MAVEAVTPYTEKLMAELRHKAANPSDPTHLNHHAIDNLDLDRLLAFIRNTDEVWPAESFNCLGCGEVFRKIAGFRKDKKRCDPCARVWNGRTRVGVPTRDPHFVRAHPWRTTTLPPRQMDDE